MHVTSLGRKSSVHIIELHAAAVVQVFDYCHGTGRTALELTGETDKA
ncbi:hypothetical protein [Cutibacterium modestum]|uniref:Uncharacterized protein n=2 Tax=Cutibacterium modestum TaxID=2559073 RepID=A0AAD1NV73_9ACTN|nr:hypothetical protein [Cutibacterium modestum]EFS75152.1 hypothetical protein HMPREF9621_00785 [Cutibacterium modestum HL037PA2]EFS93184.1 hypothetical protein HMPREF9607_00661 [Cutibacterium modestum HL044PA1]EFT15743.1 hypothetical protein HMPREF9622_01172 [Cutibacterium modestum HL037PA3]EGG26782.1 hypothetical protein PA08_1017 [Cutibacterium modestum P08]BCY25537.1 hypothetical protein KB1_15270 [Cutibacterium modestum]